MIHLGDITKISGYEVPIVDCVIGGSPCQDLSIAGKRAGLAGERSGLYIEQIRLIKEMREQYVREHRGSNVVVRPRYMVWENVPGAFSSNGGKDFAAVLEEAIRIAEPKAPDVPVPEKGWPTAGSIVGDGWSVAWRTHDAQYWGVPQRRKRISLVADFGGRTAPEILFECKSVSRNTEPGGEERERPSEGTERSVRSSSGFDGNMGAKAGNIGYAQEQSPTLNAGKIMNVISFEPGIMSRDGGHCYEDVCRTLRANMGDNQFAVCGMDGYNGALTGDVSSTLGVNCGMTTGRNGDGKTVCTITGDHENRVTDYTAVICADVGFFTAYEQLAPSQLARQYKNPPIVNAQTVRRLTPLECERLQGFQDNWTNIGEWIDSKGKKHECSDSARYKALGNSIALPFWRFLCKRISAQYARKATMASLFDGIGGFPLVWEEANGKGSAVWASEIDPFCVAVTKRRFGDE